MIDSKDMDLIIQEIARRLKNPKYYCGSFDGSEYGTSRREVREHIADVLMDPDVVMDPFTSAATKPR